MVVKNKSVGNCSVTNSSPVDSSNFFTVTWTNLTYCYYPTVGKKLTDFVKGYRPTTECKTVFRNFNGSFRSGQLTAIMGPSGSGKSTLLECLAGVRKVNQVGAIKLHGSISHVTLSFIPQDDQLLENLTVRELMTYAARLQLVSKRKTFCYEQMKTKIDKILSQLNILGCADQVIGSLSGGQKGRLSIAHELIASPDIIIMDEPTSCLDSTSSYSLIKLLIKLASSLSLAIVITIHQPSSRIFSLLQDVYMLSFDGKLVFKGKSSQVISTLKSVGIKFDPFNNPADVLLDVANGEYGIETIESLAESSKNHNYRQKNSKPLTDCLTTHRGTFMGHLAILVSRQLLQKYRLMLYILLLYSVSITVGLLSGIIFYNIGIIDGCLTEKARTWLKLGRFEHLLEHLPEAISKNNSHVGAFFFLLIYYSMVSAIIPSASIPVYAKMIRKECFNNWYGRSSLIVAFIIADLPFLVSSITLTHVIFFILTNQAFDRFFPSLLICVLAGMNTQARGFIFGSLFIDNVNTAVLMSPNATLYDALLSGFLVPIKHLPSIIQTISSISFARISTEGVIIAVFGFQRCTIDLTDTVKTAFNDLTEFLDTIFMFAHMGRTLWAGQDEARALKNKTDTISIVVKSIHKEYLHESTESRLMKQFELEDSLYIECVFKLMALCLITQFFAVVAFRVCGCRKK